MTHAVGAAPLAVCGLWVCSCGAYLAMFSLLLLLLSGWSAGDVASAAFPCLHIYFNYGIVLANPVYDQGAICL